MATFEKRIGDSGKTTWRVKIRRTNGPQLTKSFSKKVDAEEWARSIEHKLDAGDHVPSSQARRRTVADAIDRYASATARTIADAGLRIGAGLGSFDIAAIEKETV